ncbi:MAG: biotin/lipoyl-containing protein, partial [Candidatus Latescibacteria bacterium]|nr:biotin/lipoyl-containing protein [Candidatus Latescibacterota bacterium]
IVPNRVALPLNQHVGMPATAVVDVGEKVTMGQMVAQVPADKLGVAIHASIDGTVRATEPDVVIERS